MTEKTQRLTMEFVGTCVCGKKVFASADPPAVGHEPPICEAFTKMDADEFLGYFRKARENGSLDTRNL